MVGECNNLGVRPPMTAVGGTRGTCIATTTDANQILCIIRIQRPISTRPQHCNVHDNGPREFNLILDVGWSLDTVDKVQDDIGEDTRAHSHFPVEGNTSFRIKEVWIDGGV